ncbi:MAG: hypothetical protein HUJ31_09615 [Pseudomonadales bacterium]|nr:hypothetical protein [Pseudomonadales bacterium]
MIRRLSAPATLMVFLALAGKATAESPFTASIAVDRNYGYQGLSQGEDRTLLSASARYSGEHFVAGMWVGEYELPWYEDGTEEVDWFIGYQTRLSFDQRIETSLWHYTYLDDAYERYDWTQWIASYHLGQRLTITAGLADNLLGSEATSSFAEVTLRHAVGPLLTSLGIGRNNLSNTRFESFEYARAQASWGQDKWSVYVNYTWSGTGNYLTELVRHEGPGLGFSYRLH